MQTHSWLASVLVFLVGVVDVDLDRWADVIRLHQAQWKDTFVYFKHEEEGKGPEFARRLIDRLG